MLIEQMHALAPRISLATDHVDLSSDASFPQISAEQPNKYEAVMTLNGNKGVSLDT